MRTATAIGLRCKHRSKISRAAFASAVLIVAHGLAASVSAQTTSPPSPVTVAGRVLQVVNHEYATDILLDGPYVNPIPCGPVPRSRGPWYRLPALSTPNLQAMHNALVAAELSRRPVKLWLDARTCQGPDPWIRRVDVLSD